MATKVADRAFIDTNVLLAATDKGRTDHGRALAVLDEWVKAGTVLYTSGQVFREYLLCSDPPYCEQWVGSQPNGCDKQRSLFADAFTFSGRERESC